jgi:hypothetical protein
MEIRLNREMKMNSDFGGAIHDVHLGALQMPLHHAFVNTTSPVTRVFQSLDLAAYTCEPGLQARSAAPSKSANSYLGARTQNGVSREDFCCRLPKRIIF